MPQTQDYMEGKLFINYGGEGGGGFSELYKMPTISYAAANTSLLQIIENRAAVLPYDWSIVHAANSLKTKKNDSSLPVGWTGFPILLDVEADLSTDALCNDREVAMLFKFDTNGGKQSNRLLRAIRDDWVAGNESQVVVATQYYPFAHTATSVADGYGTAIENYLNTVALHTAYMVPGLYQFASPPAPKTFGWDILTWSEVNFNRIGDRDMGRGFSSRRARRKRTI